MTITVTPDEAKGAGHARIRIAGGAGAANPSFRIARPGWPEPNLGARGWQGAEAALQPDAAAPDGADLVLAVGPAVCGFLDEGTYVLSLYPSGPEGVVAWPTMEDVHGGMSAYFARVEATAPPPPQLPGPGQAVSQPAGPVVAPVVVPPAVVAVQGPPPPDALRIDPVPAPPGSGKAIGLGAAGLGLAILVLLAAGGGAWWWSHREPPAPPPAPPMEVLPPAPPPAPAAATDPDTLSVAELVAANDPQLMLAQATKRLAGKPQDSILLLEAAGEDRHFGPALTQLGRLYDPNLPRQGGLPADPRQAAKYYRDADRNNDHAGSADREALRKTLQSRRDTGDLNAKLTEQDFWP